MAEIATEDFAIRRGATFSRVLRWESLPYVYKQIQAISKAAPAVVDCTGHGAPDGWRVAIVSSLGMTEINAAHTPPWAADFVKATKLSADKLELNKINSSGFTEHTAGTGYVQYYTPVDLDGYVARMTIKNRAGGDVLAAFTSDDGDIVIDNTAKTITLTIAASETEVFTFSKGRYDFEMESAGGVVTPLLEGAIVVTSEITT